MDRDKIDFEYLDRLERENVLLNQELLEQMALKRKYAAQLELQSCIRIAAIKIHPFAAMEKQLEKVEAELEELKDDEYHADLEAKEERC